MDFDSLNKNKVQQPRLVNRPVATPMPKPVRPSRPVRPSTEGQTTPSARPQAAVQPTRKQPERVTPAPSRPNRPVAKTGPAKTTGNRTSNKKLLPRLSKKAMILAAIALALAIITTIVIFNISIGEKPGYKTVLPAGKSVSQLGGWKKISPPNSPAVYMYTDKINGTDIQVSQQSLPDDFKASPEKSLENMAKQFNATDKLKDTGAYIGTSSKGPQFVLLVKNNTLVMIKSQSNISIDGWVRYVSSLK